MNINRKEPTIKKNLHLSVAATDQLTPSIAADIHKASWYDFLKQYTSFQLNRSYWQKLLAYDL